MRLVSYGSSGSKRLQAGVLKDGYVFHAGTLVAASGTGASVDPTVNWNSTRAILQAGAPALEALELAVQAVSSAGAEKIDLNRTWLGPPVPDPSKIIGLGANYLTHAEEADYEPPSVPILFAKFSNCLIGPSDPIVLPAVSESVDYEAELAVVIGVRCKNVPPENVHEVLAGATAFNDVSARDLQVKTSQWTAGKALDTFGPCGPSLVTLDELGDLQTLAISARLNGVTVQEDTTESMIFSVAESVSYISNLMTLEPGDIIATGTPAGVGFFRSPPRMLAPGDIIEVEIGGIGLLRNPVVAADDTAVGCDVI